MGGLPRRQLLPLDWLHDVDAMPTRFFSFPPAFVLTGYDSTLSCSTAPTHMIVDWDVRQRWRRQGAFCHVRLMLAAVIVNPPVYLFIPTHANIVAQSYIEGLFAFRITTYYKHFTLRSAVIERHASRERRERRAGAARPTMQALVVVHYPGSCDGAQHGTSVGFLCRALLSATEHAPWTSLCPDVACVAGSSFRRPDRRFLFECDIITCMHKVLWMFHVWT